MEEPEQWHGRRVLDLVGELADCVKSVSRSVRVGDVHMFCALPVLLDILSQSVLPGYCVRYRYEVYVYDGSGKTVCLITPRGVEHCPLEKSRPGVADTILSSLADKYYTLGVLVLGSVPDEARNTQGYASLAEGVERLASLGAAVDAGLLDTLQGLLDHLKTRVYAISVDEARLQGILEEMGRLSRYEALSSYTREEEVRVVRFSVPRHSMELAYRDAPVSINAKLYREEAKAYLVTYVTYRAKFLSNSAWCTQPELCQNIDIEKLKKLTAEWRGIASRALRDIASDGRHHKAITRIAEIWLDILNSLGNAEKELP